MKNTYDAIVFDLDGTLADTLADIAAACNHAITELGHAAIEIPRYRYLAGQGLRYLIEHALAVGGEGKGSEEQIEQGMDLFRSYYADHFTDFTQPFDGMGQVLDALALSDIKTAVLSNKPHSATVRVMDDVFSAWSFDVVCGAKDGVALKPDPASAFSVTEQLDVQPARVAYVGDTRVDMETAKAAGFYAIGVTWGFRDEPELRDAGADVIISHPVELLAILGLDVGK